MSCIINIGGEYFDVDAFAKKAQLKNIQKRYKGDVIDTSVTSKQRRAKFSNLTIVASQKDFDDFEGQVSDVVTYLEKNKDSFKHIASTEGVDFAILDFGIDSEIDNKTILTQSIFLNTELIHLCGQFKFSIEISIYSQQIQDVLDKKRTASKNKS